MSASGHEHHAKDKILEKFTEDEIETYRKQFAAFDLNGDGEISAAELEKVSKSMGYKMTKKGLKEIMRAIDLDDNGTVSFEEFLLSMPTKSRQVEVDENRPAEIRRKFIEYDRVHIGRVTGGEGHGILRKELGFTPQQAVKLVEKYERNKDGYFYYEDFIHFYKHAQTKAAKLCEILLDFDRKYRRAMCADEARAVLSKLHIPEKNAEGLLAIHARKYELEKQYEESAELLLHS